MKNNLLYKLMLPLAAILALAGCNNKKGGSSSLQPSSEEESSESESPYDPKPLLDVDSFDRTYVKVDSDSIYVNKVENLTDQNYILGMDASSVIVEEESGVKYYDFEGNEADVFKVLSDSGINYIRVRIWNDPYDEEGHGYGGGNNDIAKAIEIGKRATQYNMSLLVDFHYSDFWADPSKQMSPKAWSSMFPTDKAPAGYQFTKDCLQQLVDNNVVVGMVQIGNETNGGKIAGMTGWSNFRRFANKCAEAIREVTPNALIALHFTNPENQNNMLNYAEQVKDVDYDVFGTSYYPYWHGTLDNLSDTLSKVARRYDKYVMVMETAYTFNNENTDFFQNTIGEGSGGTKDYPATLHGQINSVRNVIDTVVNRTINGIGVCYWEGTWISVGGSSYEENFAIWEEHGSGWATSYSADYDPEDAGKWYGGCAVENQAFFDATGHPLESLKLFNLVRFGNEIERFVDGVLDVELIKYDTDSFTLPETVNAVYCDNAHEPIPVTWEEFDIPAHQAMGNGKYDIRGIAAGFTVYCHLKILEYNYLTNYSFEEFTTVERVKHPNNWTEKVTSCEGKQNDDSHKVQVTDENPQTGDYVYHFWSAYSYGVNFELSQEVKGLAKGNYKLTLSILGGGEGSKSITPSAQNVYIYVLVNGTEVARQAHIINNYAAGYEDVRIPSFNYIGGTLVVGVHVEISEADCWGSIDDVMLNAAGK